MSSGRLRQARRIGQAINKAVLSIGVSNISGNLLAAFSESLQCDVPSSLQPLFDLLNTLTELAFLAGVTLGVFGFLTAGLFIILPGEELTRRGKRAVKYTFLGMILLLSADMIVSFLINEMGGIVCS